MKRLLILILVVLLLAVSGYAQDPSVPHLNDDDEFNLFLLALGIAFVSIIIGATLAGSMIATLAMLVLFGLVVAGVLSAGVLVGLYRKSIGAGFKTVVAVTGCLSGILIGEIGFYFINRLFHLHLSGIAVLLIGGFSGLIGGLLLGLVLFLLIRVFLNYCRARLSF
ncbi:hypothetical protein [Puia dinghuensis]|uniref:DUF456 domain-containing protein n=1 Tax=Puia dinghuensis TaxID=1792502 RepID=A0A8J2XWQ6_9BACT|nr:hypothetical protein [Puia dinghuensis]GGB21639.1 hypothetical protein GCM10011511_51820 [Puia dinghuensis]